MNINNGFNIDSVDTKNAINKNVSKRISYWVYITHYCFRQYKVLRKERALNLTWTNPLSIHSLVDKLIYIH